MKLAKIGPELGYLNAAVFSLYEAQTKNTQKTAREATHSCATFFYHESNWLKIQADIPTDANQRKGMAEPFQIEIHVGPILINSYSIYKPQDEHLAALQCRLAYNILF